MKHLFLFQGVLALVVGVLLVTRGAPIFAITVTFIASAVGFARWQDKRP